MNELKHFRQCIGKYRGQLIVGAAAVILSNALGLLPPWLIKMAVDFIEGGGRDYWLAAFLPMGDKLLAVCAGLIVLTVGLQMTLRFVWRKYLFGLARRVEYDLRNEYFRHLQKLHHGFFQHAKTGDIMSRAINDLDNVKELLGIGIVILVDSSVVIPVCLVLMTAISVKLTVIFLLPMAIASLIVMRFKAQIREKSAAVQERMAAVCTMVHENVAGIRVIQAYSQEDREIERFKELSGRLITGNVALARASETFFPFMVFTTGVTVALLLWLGGREVMQGSLTLGSFLVFTGYLAILTWPLATIGYLVTLSQRGLVSLRRLEEFWAVEPAVDDAPGGGPAYQPDDFSGTVEFRSLDFAYGDEGKTLSGISLAVGAGTMLALVGPVGAGKSTLVKLLLRIHDIPAGTVFLDGVDIKTIPLAVLRAAIGYVEQEPFLFAGTIGENILFGAISAGQREAEEAATLAGLSRDIAGFPLRLETVVGERGVTLSGGQKQRLALARALVRKSRVLILDDAFANLDSVTEKQIFADIRRALPATTIILITPKVTLAGQTDKIAVLEDGRIVACGTHEELIAVAGLYRRLWERQHLFEAAP